MTDDDKKNVEWQEAQPEKSSLVLLKEKFIRLKEELEKEKERIEFQIEEEGNKNG